MCYATFKAFFIEIQKEYIIRNKKNYFKKDSIRNKCFFINDKD